jgi:hypothetical protein
MEIVQKMQFWNDILQFLAAKRLNCHTIAADWDLPHERNSLKGRGLASIRAGRAGSEDQNGS